MKPGLLLALLAAALAWAGKPPPTFSHHVHVDHFGQECQRCHPIPREGAPRARKEACLECHEPEAPPYTPAKSPRLGLAFPHFPHLGSLGCEACHGSMLDEKRRTDRVLLEPRQCAECHERRGLLTARGRCEACHQGDQRQVRPRDHGAGWTLLHGNAGDAKGLEEHGKDCGMCHGAEACVRCHLERKPRSHTGLWDVRLHGTAATWDRESCRTCHESGTCVRCHQTNRPLNHTAGWYALHGLAAVTTDNESCRVCHTTAQCTDCHRQGH